MVDGLNPKERMANLERESVLLVRRRGRSVCENLRPDSAKGVSGRRPHLLALVAEVVFQLRDGRGGSVCKTGERICGACPHRWILAVKFARESGDYSSWVHRDLAK